VNMNVFNYVIRSLVDNKCVYICAHNHANYDECLGEHVTHENPASDKRYIESGTVEEILRRDNE
jgi:hypothetical protein